MAEPPELWTFILTNVLILGFAGLLTVLSFVAYRRRGRKLSFRNATIGFALITVGGVIEPVYELGIKEGYRLTEQELLRLHTAEGIMLAIGLGMLFYSIYYHDGEATEQAETVGGKTQRR